jgi:flagellar hook-basal body complex protein FliE
MSIQNIQAQLPQIAPVQQTGVQKTNQGQGDSSDSFGQMLETALQEVSELQNKAELQIESMTKSPEGTSPHSVMVALEKADVAFQLMSAIRGKIIRAYEEVIRTQV